ncbi:MAG: YfhO family protein, partial [Candidatus Cloacimonadota bacterium]|nr:YfhO family protein [Candidatus Cloacimonadota bacterium]
QFAVVVLAAFGIRYIIKNRENLKKILKHSLIGLVVLFVIFQLFQDTLQNMNFVKENEQQQIVSSYIQHYGQNKGVNYARQYLQDLRQERFEMLHKDSLRFFLIATVFLLLIWLFSAKKISKYVFLIVLLVVSTADLLQIDKRFLTNLESNYNINEFKENRVDKYLLGDEEIFRIFPLGSEFSQNRWAYYHQTIGGYHGAKLKRYQKIIDECLYTNIDGNLPINWNVVNMLNVKYIIFNQKIPSDRLEYVLFDREKQYALYKNTSYLPRAWFVEDLELIRDEEEIIQRLNSSDFDPAKIAIVEEMVGDIKIPHETEVSLSKFELHELEFEIRTDEKGFLTISEIYYPAGWKAFIDGKEVPIYAANYILRGVVIPEGEHILQLKFEPEIYDVSLKISLIGILIVVILLLAGVYWRIKKR